MSIGIVEIMPSRLEGLHELTKALAEHAEA